MPCQNRPHQSTQAYLKNRKKLSQEIRPTKKRLWSKEDDRFTTRALAIAFVTILVGGKLINSVRKMWQVFPESANPLCSRGPTFLIVSGGLQGQSTICALFVSLCVWTVLPCVWNSTQKFLFSSRTNERTSHFQTWHKRECKGSNTMFVNVFARRE